MTLSQQYYKTTYKCVGTTNVVCIFKCKKVALSFGFSTTLYIMHLARFFKRNNVVDNLTLPLDDVQLRPDIHGAYTLCSLQANMVNLTRKIIVFNTFECLTLVTNPLLKCALTLIRTQRVSSMNPTTDNLLFLLHDQVGSRYRGNVHELRRSITILITISLYYA